MKSLILQQYNIPVDGAVFLAAFVASCFLGALPPVDLRAVCFVLAIFLAWLAIFGTNNQTESV